jgi:hypothetical protein
LVRENEGRWAEDGSQRAEVGGRKMDDEGVRAGGRTEDEGDGRKR